MSVRAVFVTLMLPLLLLLSVPSAADQAYCKMIWLFKVPCAQQLSALLDQVVSWSTHECEDWEEKCMYELVEYTPSFMMVNHTSLITNKTNTINFYLNPPAGPSFCKIKVISTTDDNESTMPNDYCLIYNLMEGSGVTRAKGAKEICNEGMCPSLATATCKM